MITDGINIINLDTVLYVDPKYEKSDVIQSSMRPRSYDINNPNKIAYIIIPHYNNSNVNTTMTIITHLHKNNDPTINKFLSQKNKKVEKSQKIKNKTIEEPEIYADEFIKYSIINLANCNNQNLLNQIINILSDDIPRNITEIIDELPNQDERAEEHENLEDLKIKRVREVLTILCDEIIFIKFSIENIDYYSVNKKFSITWTLEEFIKKLKFDNVNDETSYREKYSNNYTNNIPIDPFLYSGFHWDLLIDDDIKFYTYNECKIAINKIPNIETSSPLDKIKYYKLYDKRIPSYDYIKNNYKLSECDIYNLLRIIKINIEF
jgi:hypothetical protein